LRRDPEENHLISDGELPGGWFWPLLALASFLSLPYYFSLETFFSHDDFTILYFHKDWPVWKPWVYFQTNVLTFYRPFQSYAIALLFHLFGLTPFPFSLVLVAIHVANIVLFGHLVERLFENRALTLLSVIFYAADWEYCDVVFWKGNYGTALCWLFVLGAANVFIDYLRAGGRGRYFGALGMTVAALLSKEGAVNAPLLLSLLYCVSPPQVAESSEKFAQTIASLAKRLGANRAARLFDLARVLWPFYALLALYAIFHYLAVRDVYDWLPKGYEFQRPREAIAAIFYALTFWLTPFVSANVSLLASVRTQNLLSLWLDHFPIAFYILPVLLIAATIVLRNRRMAFGTLWAILAFFPANLIPDFHTARYYYGSIMGIAIVFAEIILAADRAIVARRRFAEMATARVIGSLLILAFVYSNMIYTTRLVSEDGRKCREIEDLYHFLVLYRKHVPPKTLFRVWCLSGEDHFHYGMGLREMFKLALAEESVEAILPDQNLTDRVRTLLLSEYSKPVEVFRERSGGFRIVTAVPTTSTARVSQPD